jgi:hypothetical protein
MDDGSENNSSLANLHNERAHLRSELLKIDCLDTIREDGETGEKKAKRG